MVFDLSMETKCSLMNCDWSNYAGSTENLIIHCYAAYTNILQFIVYKVVGWFICVWLKEISAQTGPLSKVKL